MSLLTVLHATHVQSAQWRVVCGKQSDDSVGTHSITVNAATAPLVTQTEPVTVAVCMALPYAHRQTVQQHCGRSTVRTVGCLPAAAVAAIVTVTGCSGVTFNIQNSQLNCSLDLLLSPATIIHTPQQHTSTQTPNLMASCNSKQLQVAAHSVTQ